MKKIFVDVNARFESNGYIVPLSIIWEDGRKFDIDTVLDVRRAASLKAGGQGIRYTCQIRGKPVYLFYEVDGAKPGKWFVEGRENEKVTQSN